VVERTGAVAVAALVAVRDGVRAMAHGLGAMIVAPFQGDRMRLSRVVDELHVAGNGAVPIVTLIAFLLGLILAMQAWVQLRIFAAEIFVADMVAVGVTREIGPLMAAILVASRSGSAAAAQLGTMVINEEVDALRQMGIQPLGYLVAPRVVALSIGTPCLTLLFCAVAMAGGLVFAVTTIGTDWQVYLEQTRQALGIRDLLTAMLKATVFGALIAGVGCALGIGVKGGPEGVGRATTRAVVAAIFLIIIVDAVFVVVLRVGT
jgi:phospholipid/cholesterol/gamma-HCH transport system permease protein